MLGNRFSSKTYFLNNSYSPTCTLVTLATSLLWLQNPLEAKTRKMARCISAVDHYTPVAEISAKNINFKSVAAWFYDSGNGRRRRRRRRIINTTQNFGLKSITRQPLALKLPNFGYGGFSTRRRLSDQNLRSISTGSYRSALCVAACGRERKQIFHAPVGAWNDYLLRQSSNLFSETFLHYSALFTEL